MKILKYKYNPNKAGVFRISVVPRPAVGEGDLVLMSADLERGDAPITTYADMLVINPEGKVLILKRNSECEFEPNKWGFPGGKVMPGETTKTGSIRECLEECGIIIDPESVKSLGEVVNHDKTTSHYFSGTTGDNDVKMGDEHQDLAWVNSGDLKDYDLILNNEDRFKKLIEGEPVEMSSQEFKGVFYAPVMIPDLKITRIDEKTGEKYQVYYDTETVEQLMQNYMKQCGNRNTNLDHKTENTEDVYPVEIWIVKDPENDKSKAIGMPVQKAGTWIMGYKADNPEVLEKIKNNLLQGLSIEGHLDAEEEVNVKFNKHISMFEKVKKGISDLLVLMSAEGEEPKEKTAEELAAEESKKTAEMTAEEEAAKAAAEAAKAAEDEGEGEDDTEKELERVKAENEELKKKVSDLEAEVATYANEATLMSSQIEEVNTAFEAYRTVQMSSQSLADQPKETVVLTAADVKHAQFLKDVYSKI